MRRSGEVLPKTRAPELGCGERHITLVCRDHSFCFWVLAESEKSLTRDEPRGLQTMHCERLVCFAPAAFQSFSPPTSRLRSRADLFFSGGSSAVLRWAGLSEAVTCGNRPRQQYQQSGTSPTTQVRTPQVHALFGEEGEEPSLAMT